MALRLATTADQTKAVNAKYLLQVDFIMPFVLALKVGKIKGMGPKAAAYFLMILYTGVGGSRTLSCQQQPHPRLWLRVSETRTGVLLSLLWHIPKKNLR